MGSAAVLSLMLLAGQGPDQVRHLNQRAVLIPITVQPAQVNQIREMLLFASNDEGRTWQQVAVAPPTKDSFVFYAPADGMYWFRVGLINQQGQQEPANIMQGPPDLKMHIDTLRPFAKIQSARREGDEVVVSWDIQEQNLDLAGLRLEYSAQGSTGGAIAVNVNAGPRGDARFRPEIPGPVTVRLVAKDLAGNFGQATAEVAGGIAPAAFTPAATQVFAPPPAPPVSAVPTPAPIPQHIEEPPPPAVTPPAQHTRLPGSSWGQANGAGKIIASSEEVIQQVGSGAVTTRKALPQIQHVNSTEVNLEYELSRVGPSGVTSVELWWTQNDGQTWQQYAVDDEIRNAVPGGRYQRTLELPGDGLYGFLLIAKSAAGRGRALPKPGDAPEVRIEVDTLPPAAQLFAPQPDPRTPQTLVLSWLAKDNNLAPNPITLEWAANRAGPWQPIAANLQNSGRHSWHLPEGLPVQVFMRLRVRDTAGNEGLAVTADPQLVDLSEPEGRIVNVSVPSRR